MTTTITRISPVHSQGSASHPVLSRGLIATGDAAVLAAIDAPDMQFLSDTERMGSLQNCLNRRPAGDLWVFAYGSLIWNPAIRSAEQRIARIDGWHRAFCLSMPFGRGTAKRPGLALGLDRGGSCTGVAYRIADDSELPVLWAREMLVSGYIPRWVEVVGSDGDVFGHAITFVIDPNSPIYAGGLATNEQVTRLATAAGSWGTAVDYLLRTCDALHARGIADDDLDRMAAQVAALRARSIPEAEALAA